MHDTKDIIPKNITQETIPPKYEPSRAGSELSDEESQPVESVKKAEEMRMLVKEIEILTTI